MKKINIKYNKRTKMVFIGAKSTEFYPQYLKYMLQYLHIPEDCHLHFTDKTIKGGIEEFVKINTNKDKWTF